MGYKRYPNNSRINWICLECKVQGNKLATSAPTNAIHPNEKTLCDISLSKLEKSDFDVLDSDLKESSILCSNSDISITNITVADDIDKTSSLGTLTDKEFTIIESSTGWLDSAIIHQAKLLLKQLNPDIERFQHTTLGPVGNFDVVGGEFIQIFNSGGNHSLCVSSIGCQKGHVNLYDSLCHDITSDEVTEQSKGLPGDEFEKFVVIPVQQQNNGCDWSICNSICNLFGTHKGPINR